MVLPISEVRRIVERVCARQDVLAACAERDLGYVIAAFEEGGLTQGQMASLTGLHQNRLSDYKTGKHKPNKHSVIAAFADGLGCLRRLDRHWAWMLTRQLLLASRCHCPGRRHSLRSAWIIRATLGF